MSHNLVPAGNAIVDDAGGAYPFSTGQPNYREFLYGAVNLAGESQGFDGNGPFVRFQTGGGPQLVSMPQPGASSPETKSMWANNIDERARHPPAAARRRQPPFRMDVPCYTQDVPDLNGPAGAVGPPTPKP